MQLSAERVIEWHETFPVIDKLNGWDLLLNRIVGRGRIVDHGRFEVVVLRYC